LHPSGQQSSLPIRRRTGRRCDRAQWKLHRHVARAVGLGAERPGAPPETWNPNPRT